MITYKGMKVLLDGKIVGQIKTVFGGFSYFPKGSKTGGELFKTINLVKQSLENE